MGTGGGKKIGGGFRGPGFLGFSFFYGVRQIIGMANKSPAPVLF
jgi:hypothetical protein